MLVNIFVQRFEEDIPDFLKAFVCITACVIMQCDVQNQVFVGFLCDLLEEMVAHCCRFGFDCPVNSLSFQDSVNRRQDILLDHTSQEFVSDPAQDRRVVKEVEKDSQKHRKILIVG